MKINSILAPRYWLCALLFTLVGSWSSVAAQTPTITAPAELPPGLTITVRAGFDSYYKPDFWFPVYVQAENQGADLRASLQIITPADDYSDNEQIFELPLDLPQQSRKAFVTYVNSGADFGSNITFTLWDETNQRKLAINQPSLKSIADDLLVGVLSSRSTAGDGLASVALNSQNNTRMVYLTPTDISTTGVALQAFEILLVADFDLNKLTADQTNAIKDWVTAGGNLIVSSGSSQAQQQLQPLADWLPATFGAATRSDWAALAAAVGWAPTDAAGNITPLHLKPNVTPLLLAGEPDAATLLQVSQGSGTLTLLAFDPTLAPFADDPHLSDLYAHLVLNFSYHTITGNINTSLDQDLVDALYALPQNQIPPISFLSMVLCGYVLLVGPGIYLLLRWLGKPAIWAWAAVPLVGLLVTLSFYGWGIWQRGGRPTLHHIAILHLRPAQLSSTRVLAQMFVGVFSPWRDTLDLQLADNTLPTIPLNYDVSSQTRWQTGSPAQVRHIPVDAGGVAAVKYDAILTVPTVKWDASYTWAKNGEFMLTGHFTNQTDWTLQQVAAVSYGKVQQLGDVAPGQTIVLNSKPLLPDTATGNGLSMSSYYYPTPLNPNVIDEILGSPINNWGFDPYRWDYAVVRRQTMLRAVAAPYVYASPFFENGHTFIVAWTDTPLQSPAQLLHSNHQTEYQNLLIWELKPTLQVDATVRRLPPAFWNWQLTDTDGDTISPYDSYWSYGESLSWDYQLLPAVPAQLKPSSLTIHLLDYQGGVDLEDVLLRDYQTGDWVSVGQLGETVRWGNLTITDVDRFLSSKGLVGIKVLKDDQDTINFQTVDLTLNLEPEP